MTHPLQTTDIGDLLLGMTAVLGVPLFVSLLPWSKIHMSSLWYWTRIALAFLSGFGPVELIKWDPTNVGTLLAAVAAGVAALTAYHVPSPWSKMNQTSDSINTTPEKRPVGE